MRHLRKTYIKSVFTLVAGIAFFNLSFVLAEFKMLNITDSALVQSLINTGFEEETEHGNESSEADTSSVKGLLELCYQNLIHHQILTIAAQQRDKVIENMAVNAGYVKIISPPPDLAFLSIS
ncbi:MAG TPA: hypothetical protein VD927_06075 [Chryseosolibacter sp.]|nr:hypothetical protein [Chryseosolibacter sp.]